MRRIATVLMMMWLLLGCAHLDIHKVVSDDKNYTKIQGLRFYRPMPYLWITTNKEGQCMSMVTYLPDTSQEYVIDPNPNLIGSVSFKPTLENGWNLTGFDSSADTKISEVLNAIGEIASKTVSGGPPPGKQVTGEPVTVEKPIVITPGLYKLKFENGAISGLDPVFQVANPEKKAIPCQTLASGIGENPGDRPSPSTPGNPPANPPGQRP